MNLREGFFGDSLQNWSWNQSPTAVQPVPYGFGVGAMDQPSGGTGIPDILTQLGNLVVGGYATVSQIEANERAADRAADIERAKADAQIAAIQAQTAALSQPRIVAMGGINPMWLLGGAAVLAGILFLKR